MTRNGKIARLPAGVREELNRRLYEGERAKGLAVWLNGLPEVRAVLARDFDGKGINEPNLCAWKCGGYCDWLATREVRSQAEALASDAGELNEAVDGGLTEHLATAVAARYGVALAKWNGEVTEEFRGKVQVLRRLCRDIVGLRRGEHTEARLKLERERLELNGDGSRGPLQCGVPNGERMDADDGGVVDCARGGRGPHLPGGSSHQLRSIKPN